MKTPRQRPRVTARSCTGLLVVRSAPAWHALSSLGLLVVVVLVLIRHIGGI